MKSLKTQSTPHQPATNLIPEIRTPKEINPQQLCRVQLVNSVTGEKQIFESCRLEKARED